jgi:hypothetical protein
VWTLHGLGHQGCRLGGMASSIVGHLYTSRNRIRSMSGNLARSQSIRATTAYELKYNLESAGLSMLLDIID